MTDANNKDFFFDESIKEKVLKYWGIVFSASGAVIKQHKDFGFNGMHIPDPNVHTMVVYLRMHEEILQVLFDNAALLELEYDHIRLILNAKEQISKMERVASALKAGNKEDFDTAISELERQASF